MSTRWGRIGVQPRVAMLVVVAAVSVAVGRPEHALLEVAGRHGHCAGAGVVHGVEQVDAVQAQACEGEAARGTQGGGGRAAVAVLNSEIDPRAVSGSDVAAIAQLACSPVDQSARFRHHRSAAA